MQNFFRMLFHSVPILPFAMGLNYLGIAALLTIALWYIKTLKLTEQLSDMKEKGRTEDPEYQAVTKLKQRWAYLTFLRA